VDKAIPGAIHWINLCLADNAIFSPVILINYNITFKIAKYHQPKQYANYQPTPLAFSPSMKEQYIITIIITCLKQNNGKRQ